MKCLAIALVLALVACQSPSQRVECLATARVAADFDSYSLHRVGVLPFNVGGDGGDLDAESSRALQSAFIAELARRSHVEVVTLSSSDLEAVPADDTFHRGRTDPRAILTLAHRCNLDGVFVGHVTDRRAWAPQRLALEVELVACDTGLSIWSSSVQLDASQERVRRALNAWYETERSSEDAHEGREVYQLSPLRFAEFAASQVARLF